MKNRSRALPRTRQGLAPLDPFQGDLWDCAYLFGFLTPESTQRFFRGETTPPFPV